MEDDEGLIWAVVATVASLGASALVRKALAAGWRSRRGEVPVAPGSGDTSWREAVLYAIASGAAMGLARLVADRTLRAVKDRGSVSPTSPT